MDLKKLKAVLGDEPAYRFRQVEKAIYHDFVEDWDQVSSLPKQLRENLKKEVSLEIKSDFFVSDNKKTIKAVVELEDGKQIETVLMRHDKRNTVCVSTQVGCALGCKFCATGRMGFKRNLETHEIINQLLVFARYLKDEKITNVVFMGMGEAFLNYENVMRAIDIINDKDKFNIGARKISISTAGILDGIKKLAKEDKQINLALSLHAPNDKLRQSLMPIANKYSIEKTMQTIDSYIEKTKRKVMIEYVMIDRVNDSIQNAKELAKLLRGKLVMINLIVYNPTDKYQPSKKENVAKFKKVLENGGLEVVERFSFGHDIKAACGQLIKK